MVGRLRAPQLRSRAAALTLPRERRSFALPRPSRRSFAAGLVIAATAGLLFIVARQTSAFSVGRIEVEGGTPAIRAQVRGALESLRGTSMFSLDGAALERRVEALPAVVSVSYDRSFPHTLRLEVVPERPAAILHRGLETWLVSARGRVVAHVPNRTHPELGRIWVPRATKIAPGAFLSDRDGGAAARALALASRLPARIAVASLRNGALSFRLRSGLELRLGAPTDLRLKLAITRRALSQLPIGTAYLDVSVPGRPVAGSINPQLSGGG